MPSKPKLFIGSSGEGRAVAYAIQQNLQADAEVTVWDQGVFELSKTLIESLMSIVEAADFGIFVFSPDDILKMRGTEHSVARDNVIFELGLFIGKIGRERTFAVIPDKSELHIPTDLLGIALGKFETERSDSNLRAGTSHFCHEVRSAITKLGMLPGHASADNHDEQAHTQQSTAPAEEIDWITDFLEKRYDIAIEKLTQELAGETEADKIHDKRIYIIQCETLIDLRPGLASLAAYLEKHSDSLYVWQRVAWTYFYVGQHDFAIATVKNGLAKYPDDPQLTLITAEVHKNQGDVVTSISLLRTNTSQDEGLILQLCNFLENEVEDIEQALLIIHKAYKDNPTSEKVRYKFAKLAFMTGKHELALFLYNGLKNEFPMNSTYLVQYANACTSLGLVDLGLQAYREANSMVQEKQEWILSNIGNLLKNQGLYEEAKEYFLKAQAIDKNSAYMYERMGMLLKLQEEEGKKFEKLRKKGRTEALNAPSYVIEDVDSEPVVLPTLVLPSK